MLTWPVDAGGQAIVQGGHMLLEPPCPRQHVWRLYSCHQLLVLLAGNAALAWQLPHCALPLVGNLKRKLAQRNFNSRTSSLTAV